MVPRSCWPAGVSRPCSNTPIEFDAKEQLMTEVHVLRHEDGIPCANNLRTNVEVNKLVGTILLAPLGKDI